MREKRLGWFGVVSVLLVFACGGTERNYDTSSGGGGGSSGTSGGAGGAGAGGRSGAGGRGGAGGGSAGVTSDASSGTDATMDVGSTQDAMSTADSNSLDVSVVDASKPDADAAPRDATVDSTGPIDAPPDVPKSCKGPPTCTVAMSQVSCTGIRGCYWSQCTFKNPGLGVACGAEGPDRGGFCPPGCHLMTNCVGNGNNDYYGSPDNCGATTRQTQNACVGVGSVWQMCSWLPAVTCVGQPVRTDCTGITDAIICAQEGCSWQ